MGRYRTYLTISLIVLGPWVMGSESGLPAWAAAQEANGRSGESDQGRRVKGPTFESWKFDAEQKGANPAAFTLSTLGEGSQGHWTIEPDTSAPSAPYVLEQDAPCPGETCFHVALAEQSDYRYVDVSVQLRELANGAGSAGGIVLCAKDARNFYAVTVDLAAKSLEIVRVLDGEPTVLGRKDVQPKALSWHTLRVQRNTIVSKEFLETHFDNQMILAVWDGELRGGKIGVVTKGDGVMTFDNLSSMRLLSNEPLSSPSPY